MEERVTDLQALLADSQLGQDNIKEQGMREIP
jgi:hypothetical protein